MITVGHKFDPLALTVAGENTGMRAPLNGKADGNWRNGERLSSWTGREGLGKASS